MNLKLAAKDLRRTFDPAGLGIDTTENLIPKEAIIGQERASSALRFGLGIREDGFNVYVAGPAGSGKMTAIQAFLGELAKKADVPADWCYIYNFEDPYKPSALKLPAGQGRELQKDMKELVLFMSSGISKAFESDEYERKRDEIMKAVEAKRDKRMKELNDEVVASGFSLEMTPYGVVLIPLNDEGKPLSDSDLNKMSEEQRQDLDNKRKQLQEKLKSVLKSIRQFARDIQERVRKLDQEVALYVVGGSIDDLMEKYEGLPEVVEYLKQIRAEVLDDIEHLKDQRQGGRSQSPPALESSKLAVPEDPRLRKYQVNLLVDRSQQDGAPIVIELNPTYTNLIGRIEKEAQMGTLHTDFTLIRSGSLHQANGGYLVIPTEDVLRNLGAWDALKRSLRCQQLQIEDLSEKLGFAVTRTLRPEPIDLDVKVILIGPPILYYMLHEYDEEFFELFKVRADFDTTMDCTKENTQDFMTFLCTLCCREQCKHLERSAVAKLLEYATRLAGDKEKLSTRFGVIADVVREADFWAKDGGVQYVTGEHVQKAIEEKIYRSSMIQEKIQEMIEQNTLLIDTSGEKIGQVNGLAVLQVGDYMFGKPSRITVSVGPGREGIIDIEREVELGGPIHSKGVQILSGFLTRRFANEIPLSLAARLVFEQSYDGVEGDSASSTELYAILSALSDVPIKQGIAVTGSVNQSGEVQSIGGVNQKIEGYFDVCSARGLDGEQGVLIPRSNVRNLMLREDVMEAVEAGQFHIWAVETIDEGIEILTGEPAGQRGSDGSFEKGTLNARISERLELFQESLQKSAPEPEGEGD